MKPYLVLWLGWLLLASGGVRAETLPPGVIAIQDREAPSFTLSDMDGNAYTLNPQSSQWRFVHFWASWCGPCRREMPAIQRLSQQIDTAHWKLVLVNTAEDEDTIFTFLAAVAPDLSTLMDRDGQVTETWQPRGLPATYLVDPQGRIRYQALGGRDWDQQNYLQFLHALSK